MTICRHQNVITMPLHMYLTKEDVKMIAGNVIEFVNA